MRPVISPHEAMTRAVEAVFFQVASESIDAVLDQLDDLGYRLVPTRAAQRQEEAA